MRSSISLSWLEVPGMAESKPYVACCPKIIIITRKTAENCGVRHTAFRAPEMRSAGVRIPNFFHERTTRPHSAHFQNAMIPAAPRMAMMGVALNMKRAAFQAMNVAAKTQTPNTKAVPFRWRRPRQRSPPPMMRASKNVIGPKEAKS